VEVAETNRQRDSRPVDDGLTAAIARVRDAFAQHPRREVIEGCPHCRGSVSVDEHDLFSLTISLGGTIGGRDDVKGLLPLLLERLVTSLELDPGVVLGMLPREEWRTWPEAGQDGVDGYLDAVWRSLLAEYPSQVGSFVDAAAFLAAVDAAAESIDRFLDVWNVTPGSAADRHLADTVNGLNFAARRSSTLDAWLHRETVRDRLYRAFERDHDSLWADDLAQAYDLLRT
jgi:hypothetical protein